MTTLFVLNPHCRNGEIDTSAIVEALEADTRVETHRLGEDGPLEAAIERAGDSLQRIVVGGGDGTLNAVLPAILEAGVPMGVLPLGTANDFARSLELPGDPLEAAQIVAHGATREIDIGEINGHCFLNAAGIGLGPELTRHMDRDKKKRLGVLAYLESLIHVVGECSKRFATITVDGTTVRARFMQITIANGRHYGGGLMVSDEVQMDDGLLHLLCVRPLSPWELLLRGIRMRLGAIEGDQKLLYLKGKRVTVRTVRHCDVTADGEFVARTPIEARCLAKSLRVCVPDPNQQTGLFGITRDISDHVEQPAA